MHFAGLNRIIKRKIERKKEESADPEDPDDDVRLARLVTALPPYPATHEFIDEDVDLSCQNLSDWEKKFFCGN